MKRSNVFCISSISFSWIISINLQSHLWWVFSVVFVIFASLYFAKTLSSGENTVADSFYGAPWNDFSRIVCEAGFSNWHDIGDRLGFDWETLQSIRESNRESINQCRSLLEKYAKENGYSKRNTRHKIVDACTAVRIGGRLEELVTENGYF